MDRFDIHVSVPAVQDYGRQNKPAQETSASIAKRVKNCRDMQRQRYQKYSITSNSRLDGQALIDYATPTLEARNLLDQAANKFKLSMRSYNRILRVSRTVADLNGDEVLNKAHISEALSYRQMDYKLNAKVNF